LRPGHILAVNLGKSKSSPSDSNEDYIRGVRILGPYADVVVINVSSPNTPGLRALQGRELLEKLLNEVVVERNRIAGGTGLPKIAVKVACDLSEEELGDVASAVRGSGMEGVIVSNTTVRREGLGLKSSTSSSIIILLPSSRHTGNKTQLGGLSGRPLFPYALHALRTLRPLLPPSIPIIGCGGITTGSDAVAFARAGASLVQIYTVFGYRGVGTPRLIKDEVSAALGGSNWRDQIGRDWEGKQMGWDEARLKRESEVVRREAKGLGDLLRQLNEGDDTKRLIREAEVALGRLRESKKEEGDGMAGSRDNAMGAKTSGGGTARAMVESSRPPLMLEDSTREEIARTIEEAMDLEPEEIDLRPIMVIEQELPRADEDDEWRRAATGGSRRLV